MSYFLGMRRAIGIGALQYDLSAFDTTVSTGDSAIAAGNWAGAVIAYQAAGQSGATSLGPSIDSATNAVSQPLTQQAWSINGNLQAVNNGYNDASSGGSIAPTQSDAQNAQGFARQMSNLYHTALSQAASGAGGGGGGAPAVPSAALTATANSLVSWLQTNGCTTLSVSQVTAFQTSYNNEGSIALKVDGQYGPATQGALQRVLTASGGGTAPQNCFSGSGGTPTPSSGGGGGGAGGATPGGVVPAQASMMPWGATALVVAAAVAVGYELYQRKAHKKFGRRIGHHARRLHHGLRHRLMRRRHHA